MAFLGLAAGTFLQFHCAECRPDDGVIEVTHLLTVDEHRRVRKPGEPSWA
jgi:hypothetical protein